METILDRHIVVDGVRVAYTDAGTGPPVVLIHGTPSHAFIWRAVLPGLVQAGYRVLAFDLLGYGQSERPLHRDTSVAAQAVLLTALLDAWRLSDAHIVGHDIGGAVALILATSHPQRVCTLTLIDTVSYDSWPSATWQAIIDTHLHDYAALPAAEFRAMMERQLRMTVFHQEQMNGAVLEAYLAPLCSGIGQSSFFLHQVQHYDSRYTEALTPQLSELSLPVQLLWGADDAWQPVDYAYRLQRDIPSANLTVVPEAGHFLMEDAPERVTEELQRFIGQHP
jgi:pimeloyl-ACP methyl ester carboxylesterase